MLADVGYGQALISVLEKSYRQAAFFLRVPLPDLALVYPEAGLCSTKAEFMRPYLEALKAMICLGLEAAPGEVGRLTREYPEVGPVLCRLGSPAPSPAGPRPKPHSRRKAASRAAREGAGG